MFAEIAEDRSVLVPGEILASADGLRYTVVYPLGLIHFSTHPAEAAAVFSAISAVLHPAFDPFGEVALTDPDLVLDASVAVAKVLMTTAFKLLRDCCVPKLDGPDDPQSADAAGLWAGQSIDPKLFEPDMISGEENQNRKPVVTTFETTIGRLVNAGHSKIEILRSVQIGVEDKPLPFPGWTLRQFQFWSRSMDTARSRDRAGIAESFVAAIGACFGGDGGGHAYEDYINALNAI